MRRLLTISALLALCATSASGQPQPLQPPAFVQPKPAEKKPGPADADIAAALANDPDIKMAQAKIQLAQAELAKARQAATLRVVTLRAAIEQHKTAVDVAQVRKNTAEKLGGGVRRPTCWTRESSSKRLRPSSRPPKPS